MKYLNLVFVLQLLISIKYASFGRAFSLFEDDTTFANLDKQLKLPQNTQQTLKLDRLNHDDPLFTTFISSMDKDYSLRLRTVDPSKLGIDTVKQWSGYMDYKDSKHFFYWFFESRNDPANDPIILWLNGGPGCSSFTGLLFELGPSSIGADMKPIHNPYSWNNNASMIFLEQPLGVGFSYGDEKVSSTKLAGKDAYIFLELFFEAFPHLRSNDFHIAGESYAGHYIPQIAHEIVVKNPERTFNLTSVMIGNGITDPLIQADYYEPMACGKGGYHPVLSSEECEKMSKAAGRCRRLNKLCYASKSSLPCIVATAYCDSALLEPYVNTGLNVYDIRGPCEDNSTDGMCYTGLRYVDQYMNFPEVQETLGSDVHNYSGCDNDVFTGFLFTGDGSKPFQQYIAELLNHNIPVLIYAGDKDYICNWLGNHAWSNELEWINKRRYQRRMLKPWVSKETGEELGQVKNYGPFTFLRIYDAGHMVPYDQPEASLEMVNSWISGNRAFSDLSTLENAS
ncbi:CCQ_1a_G0003350.mRNA.1.CDS.1 [Saccharomyces cerevisiae]|nr:CCQ_1a_G0003350.mRNA.1.CDS.1 [Saccharomyces cerevisiae]CAI7149203.1 CCQ_1a_G0003350.mRNA.1.CDS.1 [Saccharomyces cerevisiae]